VKQIVIDFNRYRGLGLKRREAFSVAVMRYRVQRLLKRHEKAAAHAKKELSL
jgi:hypothetical protein